MSHGIARTAAPRLRSEEARQRELQQIAAYKELVELVNIQISERAYTIELLALTTKVLNQNPEYYTIWNHRRRVLLHLLPANTSTTSRSSEKVQDVQEIINREIFLTFKLLRQHPKCYWIWNHRNWTLQQAESLLPIATARILWQKEMELVGKMLATDSRNFHAWSYRRFIVTKLEHLLALEAATEQVDSGPSLIESEFHYTTKMIKSNLSNFSAWHNRTKLMPRLLDERGADDAARKKALDDELALIGSAINTDPFDQSIWFYHQFLMSTISSSCPRRNTIAVGLTGRERMLYYEHEIESIADILDDEKECKWIYEALLHCASCYLEVEGSSTKIFTTLDMRSWLNALRKLDPLRNGRWNYLEESLGL